MFWLYNYIILMTNFDVVEHISLRYVIKAIPSRKRPPPVKQPLCKWLFCFSVKYCLKNPLSHASTTKFRKWLWPLFRPEIWNILLFSFSGKRPPALIAYDCKKTTVEWHKSCGQACWQIKAVDLEKKAIIRSVDKKVD